MPFASKFSWLKVQKACPDLSKVLNHITTRATIPKKRNKFADVKRYIALGTTVLSGQYQDLLVVKQSLPFKPDSYRVVIPRSVSSGLLTALHIHLNHPSTNQLKIA